MSDARVARFAFADQGPGIWRIEEVIGLFPGQPILYPGAAVPTPKNPLNSGGRGIKLPLQYQPLLTKRCDKMGDVPASALSPTKCRRKGA